MIMIMLIWNNEVMIVNNDEMINDNENYYIKNMIMLMIMK